MPFRILIIIGGQSYYFIKLNLCNTRYSVEFSPASFDAIAYTDQESADYQAKVLTRMGFETHVR